MSAQGSVGLLSVLFVFALHCFMKQTYHRNSLASISPVLGLKLCASLPSKCGLLKYYLKILRAVTLEKVWYVEK